MPTVAILHHLQRPSLGQVAAPLREAGVELDERHVLRGDALPDLRRIDGIVSLGGVPSVCDGLAPLAAEAELLAAAVEAGVPVLGVCLGGQLLSHALGGAVRRAQRVLEWRELAATPAAASDAVFARLPAPVPALHFNTDVFDLPPGAIELLTGPGDGVEAFRAGDCAWGVQYHPDVDAPLLDSWLDEFAPWVEAIGHDPARVRAEAAARMPAQDAASRALFGAFARVVGCVPAR